MPRFAIVGGGFAGAIVATRLLASEKPVDVVIVERRSRLGRGLAYGTDEAVHVLNVRAAGMSAFPERTDDFLRWLRDHGRDAHADAFVARSEFGAYVAENLQRAAEVGATRGSSLRAVRAEATDLERTPEGIVVACGDATLPPVDAVVLALGHLVPQDPLRGLGRRLLDPTRYVQDPWEPGALEGIPPDSTVVLLGTGLTAVDVVLSLRRRGHRGRVVAISRRGLLPHPHVSPPPKSTFDPAPLLRARGGVLGLLRAVRKAAEAETEAGRDWRGVIDALRPHTAALWHKTTRRDRERFLRHLRPFWDTHRHRMSPQVAHEFASLLASGALVVRAGRIVSIEPVAGGVRLTWRARGAASQSVVEAARVVNVTGPSSDFRWSAPMLVASIVRRGLARPDPLGLGLETDRDGRLLEGEGGGAPDLWTLGPLRAGSLWETTAVPEIRVQALEIANRLLAAKRRKGS